MINQEKIFNPATYDAFATRMAALQQAIKVASGKRQGTHSNASVTLIAASKSQSGALLEAAIRAGVKEFGENRVQEGQEKWPELKKRFPELTLHLIGPLQSNKAEDAVALFAVIQTIDRTKIADALAAAENKLGVTRDYYIQVNIGEEAQKSGVSPADLSALLAHCHSVGLRVLGLMAVPPVDANPAPYFALLAKLAKRHQLNNLSMGMSHDFETAIRLGATHVRIGTALFGERAQ